MAKTVEMSWSWSFPAQESPSYEGYKPSQAGAFRAETKLTILTICTSEVKKVTSRAELKILQLELWLEPARLELIATKQPFQVLAYC